jgi:hypothetical protein
MADHRRFSRHFADSAFVDASPVQLFAFLDSHERLAGHMTQSSWMMGGGKFQITIDTGEGRALGSHIRMTGKAFGIPVSLDEVITVYRPPLAKTWETVGAQSLLILDRYRMGFDIAPEPGGSRLRIFVNYDLPRAGAARVIGSLLAVSYARWCVRSMLRAAQRHFAVRRQSPATPQAAS